MSLASCSISSIIITIIFIAKRILCHVQSCLEVWSFPEEGVDDDWFRISVHMRCHLYLSPLRHPVTRWTSSEFQGCNRLHVHLHSYYHHLLLCLSVAYFQCQMRLLYHICCLKCTAVHHLSLTLVLRFSAIVTRTNDSLQRLML